MHLENDPSNHKRVLVTPESYDEVTVLIDAMIPTSLFSYIKSMTTNYNAFKELHESRITQSIPTIRFSKNQLRWIGKRMAPWEPHTLLSTSGDESIKTAHQVAIEISEFLRD